MTRYKIIKNHDGFYKIGTDGSVLSRRIRGSKILNKKGPWTRLRCTPHSEGYIQVSLTKNGRSRIHLVHVLVLEAFDGPCPEGMECRHLDGNRQNNDKINLKWGTPKQNHEDQVRHGTVSKGSSRWNYKLSPNKIRRMRRLSETCTQTEIASIFGISQPYASQILRGLTR